MMDIMMNQTASAAVGSAVIYDCGLVQQCSPSTVASYQQFDNTIGKLKLDQNDENVCNFVDSGRTGRRNAIFSDAAANSFMAGSSDAGSSLIFKHNMEQQRPTDNCKVDEDDVVLAHFLGLKDQRQVASMAELALQMNDLRMKTAN